MSIPSPGDPVANSRLGEDVVGVVRVIAQPAAYLAQGGAHGAQVAVAASKQLTYPEILADLLGVEVGARRERYLTTKTRMAHLPFQRTLE